MKIGFDGCSQWCMCETSQHVRQVQQLWNEVRIVIVGRDIPKSYVKVKYAINIRERKSRISFKGATNEKKLYL